MKRLPPLLVVSQLYATMLEVVGDLEVEYGLESVITKRGHRCLKELSNLVEDLKHHSRSQRRRIP